MIDKYLTVYEKEQTAYNNIKRDQYTSKITFCDSPQRV